MADFTGFYFNNKHSSTYHLLRVSNGDRYEEELFPQFDDRTVELVGGAGNLYDSTRYKEKEFTISVVFDSLTEKDFRDIRQWLEPNKVQEFRFDERPYKAYWAKLKSPPKFDYVCFMKTGDEGFNAKQERVYKGEAELNFVAYNPFGYCHNDRTKMTESGLSENKDGINWQSLDSYSHVNGIHEDNLVEWAAESGLKSSAELERYNVFEGKQTVREYRNVSVGSDGSGKKKVTFSVGEWTEDIQEGIVAEDVPVGTKFNDQECSGLSEEEASKYQNGENLTEAIIFCNLYNPGDFEADFELYFPPFSEGTTTVNIYIYEGEDITKKSKYFLSFSVDSIKRGAGGDSILIDTKKHSLKTILDTSANLRYDLIKQKTLEWLKIPLGNSIIKIECKGGSFYDSIPKIKYGYKYY